MRRRDFLGALGSSALAWPVVALAQQGAMPLIGFLHTGSLERTSRLLLAFHEGLKQTGYVEGENVAVEYRWANDQRIRLDIMADELVRRQVSVIVAAGGSPAALVAKTATTKIPIVFAVGVDPVRVGLVSALNQPSGNITGATMLAVDLGSKRLELLCEVVPGANVIAALVNPASVAATTLVKDLNAAASALGRQVHVLNAITERDFEPAFSAMAILGAGALVIGADPLFNNHSEELAALTIRHAIPTIYQFHEFTKAGGLMSYGGSVADTYRYAGLYAGRILKGEKPSELPIQQVAKIEMIINLTTARTLGLTIPLPLLGRADEVIE